MEKDNKDVEAVAKEPAKGKGLFGSMSVYGFEYAVAMVAMVILTVVLINGVYALFSYFHSSMGEVQGNVALWAAASTLVWLPVAYIFYRRVRSYWHTKPEIVNDHTQRAFTMIYQVAMIIGVISFAFTAIFSALQALTLAKDVHDSLLTVALPSFVAAVICMGAFFAFFRKPATSGKAYATMIVVISLLVVIPVIITSVMLLRGINQDKHYAEDLGLLRRAVVDHYYEKKELASSLRDVSDQIRGSLNNSIDTYTYNKKDNTTFELCADFNTNTIDKYKTLKDSYSDSTNYYRHESGKQCFGSKVSDTLYQYR